MTDLEINEEMAKGWLYYFSDSLDEKDLTELTSKPLSWFSLGANMAMLSCGVRSTIWYANFVDGQTVQDVWDDYVNWSDE